MNGKYVSASHPDNEQVVVWGTPEWRAEMTEFFKEYRGWTFVLKPYAWWSDAWDHDHCICCGKAIAEPGAREDAISLAYSVSDQHPRGADYEWLCTECARELAPALELRLVNA